MPRWKSHSTSFSRLAFAGKSALRPGTPSLTSWQLCFRSTGLAAGLFIVFLSAAPVAHAFDPWTTRDTVLQGTLLTLMVIDYKQTLEIRTGKYPNVTETNGALGKQPTREEIARYFAGTALLHTALMTVLPKDWRLALQSGAIGVELSAISNNYQLGVAIRF